MKKITDSLLKRIVRQSLNESFGLLNEATFATGKITSAGVEYENLDITENPCPRGGFCLTPATNSGYKMASEFVKETSIPKGYTEQITWMESVMALCDNEEYSKGEPMDESTIGNIVSEIQDEMDDTSIDEPLIKKKIILLGDFPSFCIAKEKSNSYGYDIFGSNAEGRMNYGVGDNDDYKNYIVLPVFQLLQNSISKTKKFEPKFLESVAAAAKTQKPKIDITTGGGGTPNYDLPIDALPCVLEHPALINKKEPLKNGFGFKLNTGVPIIDSFIFGVTKDPNVVDSGLFGKKLNTKNDLELDFDCNDKYIQVAYSQTTWDYDNVMDSSLWVTAVNTGRVALTTHPDLEDDGEINKSIQTERTKGFRHNLLTEVELKLNDKGEEVRKIQKKLQLPPDRGTPTFGPDTLKAVINHQKTEGAKLTPPLNTTGLVDQATYDSIMAIPDPIVPSATKWIRLLDIGSTGPDVEAIQTKLNIKKGKYGTETQTEVTNYQKKYSSLDDTGIVDEKTFNHIMANTKLGTDTSITYSGKKHNYKIGDWIKVNPLDGSITEGFGDGTSSVGTSINSGLKKLSLTGKNFGLSSGSNNKTSLTKTVSLAAGLTDNGGVFKITDVPDVYTVILDVSFTANNTVIGGSTQKVLFGEQASEGSKTIVKRDRNNNNNNNNNSGTRSNTNNSGRRSNNNNSSINTVDAEKQKQRDVRNKEFCDTLRQVKQYINNNKGGDLTVNCQRTQKTKNQIMMALTGGTIGTPVAPVAPVAPVDPVSSPGGNVTVY